MADPKKPNGPIPPTPLDAPAGSTGVTMAPKPPTPEELAAAEAARAKEAETGIKPISPGLIDMPKAAPVHDDFRDARERSKSGNVFRVLTNIVNGPKQGTIAADVDFPDNTIFADLMRVGAIEPAGALRSDPAATLRTADHLDEVEGLHRANIRLEAECERLTAENNRLSEALTKKT